MTRFTLIFISSHPHIFTLVFPEALNFWSFCGTCPEPAEGRQKYGMEKNCFSIIHGNFNTLHCVFQRLQGYAPRFGSYRLIQSLEIYQYRYDVAF